jgi:hypothetical protein
MKTLNINNISRTIICSFIFASVFFTINSYSAKETTPEYTSIKGVSVTTDIAYPTRIVLTVTTPNNTYSTSDPVDGNLNWFKILQAQAIFAKTSGSLKVKIMHDGTNLYGIIIDE